MTRSVILVPPLIKYSAGPLLWPSLLKSAARLGGHQCQVVDLKAMYIKPRVSKRMVAVANLAECIATIAAVSTAAKQKTFIKS